MNTQQPKGPFCQSCAMPMAKSEDFGTNADGSQNQEYCHYCYQNGAFTEPHITMEQMIEKCAGIMKQMNIPETQIEQTKKFIPILKRWRKQKIWSKLKKSWQEKLKESHGLPKVAKITPEMAGRWGAKLGETIAIPAPIEVDEIMRKVPKGKLITINEIRKTVAKKHKATIGCPITSGIFALISARAAEEAKTEGKKNITPYWRTLKVGGVLNEKYPAGIEAQKKLLEKEGHKVIQKGKKFIVVDFEKSLVKL